jgi:hypothetical protein
MTLQNFNVQSRQYQRWQFSGIDSIDDCLDKDHFKNFGHTISYNYNSRGFRDSEWPDELDDCIWCIGDSFTVGIGSPLEHTWVYQLQKHTNKRCINVSMDGASNDWILDRVNELVDILKPKNIVVQWSFLHRGQSNDDSLSGEDRRVPYKFIANDEQIAHFIELMSMLKGNVIHSFIPYYCEYNYSSLIDSWQDVSGPDWPTVEYAVNNYDILPAFVLDELENMFQDVNKNLMFHANLSKYNPLYIKRLDIARDGYHYDIKTASTIARHFAQQIK